jgi:hypothetical protein
MGSISLQYSPDVFSLITVTIIITSGKTAEYAEPKRQNTHVAFVSPTHQIMTSLLLCPQLVGEYARGLCGAVSGIASHHQNLASNVCHRVGKTLHPTPRRSCVGFSTGRLHAQREIALSSYISHQLSLLFFSPISHTVHQPLFLQSRSILSSVKIYKLHSICNSSFSLVSTSTGLFLGLNFSCLGWGKMVR